MSRPAKLPPPEELPLLMSLGVVKSPKGFVCAYTESRGEKIVEREILGDPGSYSQAVQRMLIEVVVRFQSGKAKVRA